MPKFQPTRIDPPGWATQPKLSIDGVTVAEFAAIQAHRDKLLAAVHREVTKYLNDPRLVFTDPDDADEFPHRDRLTGDYYIGGESYIAHRDPTWVQISVRCRFLEPTDDDEPDDYLGLEVWLRCKPGKRVAFTKYRNTDSSVI
jgi:hypothetical protein